MEHCKAYNTQHRSDPPHRRATASPVDLYVGGAVRIPVLDVPLRFLPRRASRFVLEQWGHREIQRAHGTPAYRRVWSALASYARPNGRAWRSNVHIAEAASCCTKTVQRATSYLRGIGILDDALRGGGRGAPGGRGRANHFWLGVRARGRPEERSAPVRAQCRERELLGHALRRIAFTRKDLMGRWGTAYDAARQCLPTLGMMRRKREKGQPCGRPRPHAGPFRLADWLRSAPHAPRDPPERPKEAVDQDAIVAERHRFEDLLRRGRAMRAILVDTGCTLAQACERAGIAPGEYPEVKRALDEASYDSGWRRCSESLPVGHESESAPVSRPARRRARRPR